MNYLLAEATETHLPLEYVTHAGASPTEARSARHLHRWCWHDNIYLAVEFHIEPCPGADGFQVWGATIARDGGPNSNGEDSVCWYVSPELPRFFDAEAFCQFAWQRWCATGRLSASGMEWQSHLDANRNPHPNT